MSRKLLTLIVAILTLAISSPSQSAQGKKAPKSPSRIEINDVYVIHLILDGTNYETMMHAISEGKMPTLEENFIKKGSLFAQGISTFPSTSTTAYQSFITGLLPGHAGIPHLQRFDRQRERPIDYLSASGYKKINTDLINLNALQNPNTVNLDPLITIFELLSGHPTLSLYTTVKRGSAKNFPKVVPLHALWSTYVTNHIENVDVLAFEKIMEAYNKPTTEIPRYSLVGLYSSDITGHHFGALSSNVCDVLIQFDIFLRDFLKLLEEKGIREKTYIIISADHGMHNTNSLFKFREASIKKGIAVKPRNPKKHDFNFYAADRGVSSTHVYTKRTDGSFSPLTNSLELRNFPLENGETIDLIDFLTSLEPTELIVIRNGQQSVMVFDNSGNSSEIRCFLMDTTNWCSYEVLSNNDPLHFYSNRAKKLMDGKPHASNEWKYATAGEYYTDAVIQLGTIFQDGRAGDIFIIPKNKWGFRKIKKATHGSLISSDMHIPIFISGPTVPNGTFMEIRTVDIFPLLLEWFGIDVPKENYDGRNPFLPYTSEDKDWQSLATLEQIFSAKKYPNLNATINADKIKLRPLALYELKKRSKLLEKINLYIEDLKKHPDTAHSLDEISSDYMQDHLEIAERIKLLTLQRKEVMEKIVKFLSRG